MRPLTPTVCVSAQIAPDTIAEIAALGFHVVINNRPDGEEPGQPSSQSIAQACAQAGLAYYHIPLGPAGIDAEMIAASQKAFTHADTHKVFAFCRSGNRSTLLWGLAMAAAGQDPDHLAACAREAGYNLSPVMAMMQDYAR